MRSLKQKIDEQIHEFFMGTWYNMQKRESGNAELRDLSYKEYLRKVEANKGLKQMAVFFSFAAVILGVVATGLLLCSKFIDMPQATNLTIVAAMVSVALAIRGWYGAYVSHTISPYLRQVTSEHDEVSNALRVYPIWDDAALYLCQNSPNLKPDGVELEIHEQGKFSEFWRLYVSSTLRKKGRMVPHDTGGKPDKDSLEYRDFTPWYLAALVVGAIERELMAN